MPSAKKTLKVIGIILFVPIAIILIILLVLFVQYRLSIRDFRDYSGGPAIVYTETASLKKLSLNLLNNNEVNSLLRLQALKGTYKIIADLKQNPFLKNPFLLGLIDVPAGFALYEDMTYLISADLKAASMLSRYTPSLLFLAPKGMVKRLESNDGLILQISADGAVFYAHVKDNIVLFSNSLQKVETAVANYGSRQSAAFKASIDESARLLDRTSFLDVFIDPGRTVKGILTPDAERDKWMSLMNLHDNGVVSIGLEDKNLDIRAVAEVTAQNEKLGEILTWKPEGWKVFSKAPENITALTGLNFKSFQNLYGLFLEVKGQDMKKMLADLNGASGLLFGMDIQELLFSWMGHEAGLFFVEGNLDPVIYVEVGDLDKYRKVMKKITTSLVVSSENDVLIGDLKLSRIIFPPFIRMILDMFVKGLETPYYTDNGAFVYFSMNPENLAKTVEAGKSGKVFGKSEAYKAVDADSLKKSQFAMFFDTSAWIPPFAARDSLLSGLFDAYGRGLISFEGEKDQCTVKISLQGLVKAGIRPFAGFPRTLEGGAKNVWLADLRGTTFPEVVWLDESGKLHCADLLGQENIAAETGKDVQVFLGQNKGKSSVWVYRPSGEIFEMQDSWTIPGTSSIIEVPSKSVNPLYFRDAVYMNDTKEKALLKISLPDGEKSLLLKGLPSRLFDAPAASNSSIVFGTKDFEGSIFLTDPAGNLVPGFPVYSGGISVQGPSFVTFDGKAYICQLTQAGLLNLWDFQGVEKSGFPVEIKGVFDTRPVVYSSAGIETLAVIDREGNISLIGASGSVLKSTKSKNFSGEGSRLAMLDLYGDREPELIVYGGKSKLEAYDSRLQMLEGFPILGGNEPWLVDLDSDGTMEIISAGYDDRLYVYSLKKEDGL